MKKAAAMVFLFALLGLAQFVLADVDPSKRVKIADDFNDSSFNASLWQAKVSNPSEDGNNVFITSSDQNFWSLENVSLGDNVTLQFKAWYGTGSEQGFGFWKNNSVMASWPSNLNNAFCAIYKVRTGSGTFAIYSEGSDTATYFSLSNYANQTTLRIVINKTQETCDAWAQNESVGDFVYLGSHTTTNNDWSVANLGKYIVGMVYQTNTPFGVSAVRVLNLSIAEAGGSGEVTESEARNAIETGINNTLSGHTILMNQQVYERTSNNTQVLGTFDKFVIWNSKRWAFNYVNSSESFTNMASIGTTLNIWENQSLTTAQIQTQVEALINATK